MFLFIQDEAVKVVVNPNSDRRGLTEEMNGFLYLLQGKTSAGGLAKEVADAVDSAKEHKEWEVEYMTMQLKLLEEREAGRAEEIYQSVQDGDYSASRGAEKLKISLDELRTRMKLAGYTFLSE